MRSTFVISAAVTLFAAASAHAQILRAAWSDLEPVEQTIGDVNPIATSTRLLRPDLRLPLDFSRVYRIPGSSKGISTFAPAAQRGTPQYQRISGAGGLVAVFNQSEYHPGKKGQTIPDIPAGTVYYIGGLPQDARVAKPGRLSPHAAFSQVSTFADTLANREAAAPARVLPADGAESWTIIPPSAARQHPQRDTTPLLPRASVLTDESFRRQRIRQLLLSAVPSSSDF